MMIEYFLSLFLLLIKHKHISFGVLGKTFKLQAIWLRNNSIPPGHWQLISRYVDDRYNSISNNNSSANIPIALWKNLKLVDKNQVQTTNHNKLRKIKNNVYFKN